MLPKIIVAKSDVKDDLYSSIDLNQKNIMEYEGSEAKVDELRSWILAGINAAKRDTKLNIVIWNSDLMSSECQAVLLKPLEELDNEIKMYLVAASEAKMLPTIISRCLVEYLDDDKEETAAYWNDVRKCWASGPAACISFSDSLDKEQAKIMIREVIVKLKNSLGTEINSKRLKVIDNALNCLSDLESTNINQKLSVDNFLISSWRLIKT